jgi:two-component system sensor histidine kinase CpxA
MASRLAQLVHGQKRFLGDVAHELCSPISRMQFALGILERQVPETTLADLNEEIQQMSSLVQELLQFSKASIQQPGRPLETVNLAETLHSAAQREGVTVQLQIDPALRAQADSAALSRALSNLIRNAWRYAGDAGPIAAAAFSQNGHVRLCISDHGPGLPDAELSRVTAPFYRPELARTRESGGVGLGLAIVKTCIDACQGTVRLRNRQPHGLEVEITLKAA